MTAPKLERLRQQITDMEADRGALRREGIPTRKLDQLIQAKRRAHALLAQLHADLKGATPGGAP